jgi:hypothetical protein
MLYCIREATFSDIDRVAALIEGNAGEWSGSTATAAATRLFKVWRLSVRVRIAVMKAAFMPPCLPVDPSGRARHRR